MHALLTALCSFPLPNRKVVRRASLSDRTNLYRKECEKEAIVWQQLGAAEEGRNSGLIGEIGETRSDQENTDPVRNLFCLMESQQRVGNAAPGMGGG